MDHYCMYAQAHLQFRDEEWPPEQKYVRLRPICQVHFQSLPLKSPPRSGPATAEQLQVILNACDHVALFSASTISEVITQTEPTIPPPPIPASPRARTSHRILYSKMSFAEYDDEPRYVPVQLHRAENQGQRRKY